MLALCGVFLLFLTASAVGQCPSNWVRHADSCYHFSHDIENWPDSMVICMAVGAYLVEIDDASENSFIQNNMIAANSWIGLSDLAEEGAWKWMHSQTDPSFTAWHPGEPNNSGTNENCVLIYKTASGWNDGQCQGGSHYVCEQKIEGVDQVVG